MYRGPLIQCAPFPLQKEKIREKFVEALKTEFAGKGLRFSRGTLSCGGPRHTRGQHLLVAVLLALFSDTP